MTGTGDTDMKITYLGHSGFLVETKEHYLLFDYYTGKPPVFSPDKNLTVFVSHSHQDHYNKEIFALQYGSVAGGQWKNQDIRAVTGDARPEKRNIVYVLSKDVNRKQAEKLIR